MNGKPFARHTCAARKTATYGKQACMHAAYIQQKKVVTQGESLGCVAAERHILFISSKGLSLFLAIPL